MIFKVVKYATIGWAVVATSKFVYNKVSEWRNGSHEV